MKRLLILAGVAMLGSTAATAQEAPPQVTAPAPSAAPDATTAPPAADQSVVPAAPDAAAQASAPAAADASAPAATSTPKKYPLCSRTVRDECRNRGGI